MTQRHEEAKRERRRAVFVGPSVSTPHHASCPGGDLCTLSATGSGPDVARRRGWGPGTVIEGNEGGHIARITLLYLGSEVLLATDGSHESAWSLWCRCWCEVQP